MLLYCPSAAQFLLLINLSVVTEELDQKVRALVILAKDLNTVSRAYTTAHLCWGMQHPLLSSAHTRCAHVTMRQNTLFCPPQALDMHMYTYIMRQNTDTSNKVNLHKCTFSVYFIKTMFRGTFNCLLLQKYRHYFITS